MGRSLRIARIRGIDVRLHITFPLIVLWAALEWGVGYTVNLRNALYGVLLVLLLFVCVVLHELGHSLVALRFGARVRDITLLPIGGVAQMRRMPSKPWQELLVALAGPAVNLLLALAMGVLFWLATLSQPSLTPFRILRYALRPSLAGVPYYLLLANVTMALFNLIPAFPMDGGRILRAFLSMPLGHLKATSIAGRIGQLLSVVFLLGGIYLYNPVIMLVGVFIFAGAVNELRSAEVRRVLSGITAGQALGESTAPALDPEQPLGSVTQLAVFNNEPNFPVVENGKLIGVLHVPNLNQAIRELGPWAPVRQAMLANMLNAQASDSLFDIEQRMAEEEADTVQVSDDSGFRGVLTRQHISQLYLRLTKQRPLFAAK